MNTPNPQYDSSRNALVLTHAAVLPVHEVAAYTAAVTARAIQAFLGSGADVQVIHNVITESAEQATSPQNRNPRRLPPVTNPAAPDNTLHNEEDNPRIAVYGPDGRFVETTTLGDAKFGHLIGERYVLVTRPNGSYALVHPRVKLRPGWKLVVSSEVESEKADPAK
jgi:hypothetical protein